MFTKHYPLFKLPVDTDLLLRLIRENLKVAKLFNGLASLGLDDCCFQPHLESVVLACAGFHHCPDDLITFYLDLIDEHSARITPDHDVITRESLNVYYALLKEKQEREGSKQQSHEKDEDADQ